MARCVQLAPLSPAIHLGAEKVLVIGAGRMSRKRNGSVEKSYPTLAQVAGHALSSIFLDGLAVDIERMQRINRTLAAIPDEVKQGAGMSLRPIETLVIAPSQRLDYLAAKHAKALPRSVRLLLRGIGAHEQGGRCSHQLSAVRATLYARLDRSRLPRHRSQEGPSAGLSRYLRKTSETVSISLFLLKYQVRVLNCRKIIRSIPSRRDAGCTELLSALTMGVFVAAGLMSQSVAQAATTNTKSTAAKSAGAKKSKPATAKTPPLPRQGGKAAAADQWQATRHWRWHPRPRLVEQGGSEPTSRKRRCGRADRPITTADDGDGRA